MNTSSVQASKSALILLMGVLLVGVVLSIVSVLFGSTVYVIGGLFGIFLAIIFLKKPLLGTYLIVFTFPFVSTLPRGAYIPGFKLDEVLIIIFFGLNILLPAQRTAFRLTQVDVIYLVIFIIGSFLPFIGAFLRNQQPDWVEAVALLKPLILFRLVNMSFNNRQQICWAIVLLLFGSLFVAALAGLQILNLAGIRNLLAQIYPDTSASALLRGTYNRATSTLGNWNALGGYAALGSLLCLSLLRYRKVVTFPLLVPIALAANVGTLLLAGSSSSVVGFFVGGIVWWMIRARPSRLSKRYLAGVILAFISVLIIFVVLGRTIIEFQIQRQSQPYVYDRVSQSYYPTHGIPASIVVRALLARYLIRTMIQDRIAIATGFGTGSEAIELLPWGTPESGYMVMLFFYGPFLVLFYLILLLTIILMSRRIQMNLQKVDDLGFTLTTAVITSTVSIAVMNIIHAYYSAAGVTHYYWILLGCMVVLGRINLLDKKSRASKDAVSR